jgi:hypothetical protein
MQRGTTIGQREVRGLGRTRRGHKRPEGNTARITTLLVGGDRQSWLTIPLRVSN